MAPKFNPMERLTLTSLLGGLRGGLDGDRAYNILSSVLQQQQARVQARKDMLMQQIGMLGQYAGMSPDATASTAYLNGLSEAGAIGPKMSDRLTAYNQSLYPNGGQSPMYGITGTPPQTEASVSTPQRVYSAVVTAMGVNPTTGEDNMDATPEEVYNSIVMAGDDLGWWAMQNPQEAMSYIKSAIMSVNPASIAAQKPKFDPYGPTSEWANTGGPVSNGPSFTNRQGQNGPNPYLTGYNNSNTSSYLSRP